MKILLSHKLRDADFGGKHEIEVPFHRRSYRVKDTEEEGVKLNGRNLSIALGICYTPLISALDVRRTFGFDLFLDLQNITEFVTYKNRQFELLSLFGWHRLSSVFFQYIQLLLVVLWGLLFFGELLIISILKLSIGIVDVIVSHHI